MEREYDVIGMGCCAFDIVVELEGPPEEDQKTSETRILPQGGGLVATALVAVTRLGGRAAYLGALGDDAFGDFCVQEFEREGVDTRFIERVPGGSVVVAVILAHSSAGTRTIFFSTENWPEPSAETIAEDVVRRARVVHVDNFQPEPALRTARLARAAGVPVTLDLEGGGGPADELLANCDYAVVPLEFARSRYGEEEPERATAALHEEVADCGGRVAVVTDGPRGSFGVHE
ncbi:MAG: PfkB family carbohydrate kinase, partial [Candidatus Brocadiia bacterium]